ncbi:MAG: phosphate ABC transporter permease PstA [Dehalococcoidia bacterium]|jgi:phosphate transport system permease protein|nr:phosphate ABC transporter permease PstA [Dehalococcoidia bacterium]
MTAQAPPRTPLDRDGLFKVRLRTRHLLGRAFVVLTSLGAAIGIVLLAILLVEVWREGAHFLSWDFIQNGPSRRADRAGIGPALWGSLWVISFTALWTFPVGVGAAIYLEEYARPGRVTSLIRTNISNLAGVPSIVYGLLGLQLFVRGTIGIGPDLGGFGRTVMAGSLTLALLVLPILIVASQEAIRAVPSSVRAASYGLGATRWQTVQHHVLPQALPGVMTGTILAISRAIGETAPLIAIGAVTYIQSGPSGPLSSFGAMPIQIYSWTSRPQAEFQELAATGILVLLAVLLTMNAIAVLLRHRFGQSRDR